MKFVVIPYIALGLVLSVAIGFEYNCEGQEMFPTYYGSPFVFKQKSLASSMEYFYSISGLALNVLTWSIVLYFFDKRIRRINKKKGTKLGYKFVLIFMIALTSLNIIIDSAMIGRTFNINSNYWYWDMDQKAKDWGMICDGELIILKK